MRTNTVRSTDLVRDRLDDLDPGRADADDADALAREIDRLFRPVRGVDQLALERLLSGENVRQRRREHAAAGDQELGVDRLALVGGDVQRPVASLKWALLIRRVELDVLAQVEPVGDTVQPALDLRLARELLAPAPALVQVLGEQVLVDVAFGIEARAGIAVPVPGSADVGGGVERLHRQALLAQQMQLVKPCDAGADHGGVELQRRRSGSRLPFDRCRFGHHFLSLVHCDLRTSGALFGPALFVSIHGPWNGVLNGNAGHFR